MEDVVPTWLPKGFVLCDSSVVELRSKTVILSQFNNGSKKLILQYVIHEDFMDIQYEWSRESAITHNRGGIEHFISANEDKLSVVWKNANCECYITGDITVEEAMRMINSIYER